MAVSDWLGVAGFVLSIGNLALLACLAFRDRAMLKIEDTLVHIGDNGNSTNARVDIRVSNTGRRPITVTGLGFHYPNGNRVGFTSPLSGQQLPIRLEENDSFTFSLTSEEVVQEIMSEGEVPSAIWIRDARKVRVTKLSSPTRKWLSEFL